MGTRILDWLMIRLGDGCLLPAKLDAINTVYFAPHSDWHLTRHELLYTSVHSQGRSDPTVTAIQGLVPHHSVRGLTRKILILFLVGQAMMLPKAVGPHPFPYHSNLRWLTAKGGKNQMGSSSH